MPTDNLFGECQECGKELDEHDDEATEVCATCWGNMSWPPFAPAEKDSVGDGNGT